MLFAIAVGIAWLANLRQRRTGWGMVWVAMFSSLVFQVLAAWQAGYVDPFAPVGFLMSLPVTLLLNWGVGRLVWRQRGSGLRDDDH